MKTNFLIELQGLQLEILSMNVSGPKLFQVWTTIDGQKNRFHFKGDGINPLKFALPEETPSFLLEKEISAAIFELYRTEQ